MPVDQATWNYIDHTYLTIGLRSRSPSLLFNASFKDGSLVAYKEVGTYSIISIIDHIKAILIDSPSSTYVLSLITKSYG